MRGREKAFVILSSGGFHLVQPHEHWGVFTEKTARQQPDKGGHHGDRYRQKAAAAT